MKQLTKAATYKTMIALFLLSFFQAMAWAQDSSVATTQTTTSTEQHTWYAQPWVWVVGGVVLLFLIVALARGNSSRANSSTTDKVTYTKTTETDTNP